MTGCILRVAQYSVWRKVVQDQAKHKINNLNENV